MIEKEAKLTEQTPEPLHPKEVQRTEARQVQSNQKRDSLVARLKTGNRAAAAELVDEYYEQIYLFMRRLGHDRQTSEDLTQESFFNAWNHIGQLKEGKALEGWLYRIAANVSRLYWRKHKHREIVGVEHADWPAGGVVNNDVERYEQMELLRAGIARLPVKLNEAIVLHYVQQMTIAKAAEVAGVREGTFKSRLNRALKALRKNMT